MKINRLLLASTSPYRLALLKQAGITVTAQRSDCDESTISAATPYALAKARSEGKGLDLAVEGEGSLVIAADQVLDFHGQAYGKADSREEAFERLRRFAGHEHSLHSAYCLVHYDPKAGIKRLLRSQVITAKLHMRPLSDQEIHAYLDTGEWEGCAGCYQYENRAVQLFDYVQGDLSTIIGLPIPALLKDLRELGINPLLNPNGPWAIYA